MSRVRELEEENDELREQLTQADNEAEELREQLRVAEEAIEAQRRQITVKVEIDHDAIYRTVERAFGELLKEATTHG